MRRSRRCALLAASVLVIAGCSTDQGVAAIRSVEASAPEHTVPEQTVPVETVPVETVPDQSVPDESAPEQERAGADGVGDALFPDLGNPGIDVTDYHVELTFDTATDSLAGSVTLTITPTEDRDEFTLDSSGPAVDQVTVDGHDAAFTAADPELRITPRRPLQAGDPVTVVVAYTATPTARSGAGDLPSGWFNTAGGSYVLNEPDGARRWLPSNDHPSDKATWTFAITVDDGTTAVANGTLVTTTDDTGLGTTFVWREEIPMPTYLVQLLTGEYTLVEGTGPGGVPLLSAILADDRTVMQPYLDTIDDQIDFFDDYFGPYPLTSYGLAITDSFGGLAMETQGRSMFSRDDLNGELGYIQELLLSHELAHQWFGNAVSLAEWQDIWLNESFASYAQWMWLEHVGFDTLTSAAEQALRDRHASPGGATGAPSRDELFTFNTYEGGAVVLHALRQVIGDELFFLVLQRWAQDNIGTSRSTEDFIALANDIAGTDLASFFDTWLYAERLPDAYPART